MRKYILASLLMLCSLTVHAQWWGAKSISYASEFPLAVTFDSSATVKTKLQIDGSMLNDNSVAPSLVIGISTGCPGSIIHARSKDLGVNRLMLSNTGYVFIGESQDTVIGLFSQKEGGHGSAIDFSEVYSTGTLAEKWSLCKLTSNGKTGGFNTDDSSDSDFSLNYSTWAEYVSGGANPYHDYTWSKNGVYRSKYVIVRDSISVGCGLSALKGRLVVSGTNFAETACLERVGAFNGSIASSGKFNANVKGMPITNGTGSGVNFTFNNDSGTVNSIGRFGVYRDNNTDNTGTAVIEPYSAGTVIRMAEFRAHNNTVRLCDVNASTISASGITTPGADIRGSMTASSATVTGNSRVMGATFLGSKTLAGLKAYAPVATLELWVCSDTGDIYISSGTTEYAFNKFDAIAPD